MGNPARTGATVGMVECLAWNNCPGPAWTRYYDGQEHVEQHKKSG